MNQLIAFMLVTFLFVSSFLSIGMKINNNIDRRSEKQHINLVGKSIIEYVSYDDEGYVINESDYMTALYKLTAGTLVGGIFVYENQVKAMDYNGKCMASISTTNMTESSVISVVNNVLYELLKKEYKLSNINIAESNDYIKGQLFNNLYGITVFVITCLEKKGEPTYNVAGYRIVPQNSTDHKMTKTEA